MQDRRQKWSKNIHRSNLIVRVAKWFFARGVGVIAKGFEKDYQKSVVKECNKLTQLHNCFVRATDQYVDGLMQYHVNPETQRAIQAIILLIAEQVNQAIAWRRVSEPTFRPNGRIERSIQAEGMQA